MSGSGLDTMIFKTRDFHFYLFMMRLYKRLHCKKNLGVKSTVKTTALYHIIPNTLSLTLPCPFYK